MTPTPPPPGLFTNLAPDIPEITRQIFTFVLGLISGYFLLRWRLRKNVIVTAQIVFQPPIYVDWDEWGDGGPRPEPDDSLGYPDLIEIYAVNDYPRAVNLIDAGFVLDNGEELSAKDIIEHDRDYLLYPFPAKLEDQDPFTLKVSLKAIEEELEEYHSSAKITSVYVTDSTHKKYTGPLSKSPQPTKIKQERTRLGPLFFDLQRRYRSPRLYQIDPNESTKLAPGHNLRKRQ